MIDCERGLLNLPNCGDLNSIAKLAVLHIRWPQAIAILARPCTTHDKQTVYEFIEDPDNDQAGDEPAHREDLTHTLEQRQPSILTTGLQTSSRRKAEVKGDALQRSSNRGINADFALALGRRRAHGLVPGLHGAGNPRLGCRDPLASPRDRHGRRVGHWRAINPGVAGSVTVTSVHRMSRSGQSWAPMCWFPKLIVWRWQACGPGVDETARSSRLARVGPLRPASAHKQQSVEGTAR